MKWKCLCCLLWILPLYGHDYELLAPVDTVCRQPRYDTVCDGLVYIWTKCDVLRAITTHEHDRTLFSRLIIADMLYIASHAVKMLHTQELSQEQYQHLHTLTEHLAVAYDDAFSSSDNKSITWTYQILTLLYDMTQP